MSTIFSYEPTSRVSHTLLHRHNQSNIMQGLFSSGVEEEELVTISLQVLCILVDFNFSLNPPSQQQDHMNGCPQTLTQQLSVDPRRTEEPDSVKR